MKLRIKILIFLIITILCIIGSIIYITIALKGGLDKYVTVTEIKPGPFIKTPNWTYFNETNKTNKVIT